MITNAAIEILERATCEGQRVKLHSGELPPQVYAEVDEVLRRLGGRWKGGRTRAHCFEEDPAPLIAYTLASRKLPVKNPLAFFPSPPPVVDEVVAYADLDDAFSDGWFLEPSAGRAAIAARLAQGTKLIPDILERLVLVEINPLNVAHLKAKGFRHVIEGSFLEWETDQRFDRVVANPPFSTPDNPTAYVDHILKMWQLTATGGKLVTVAPDAFLTAPDAEAVEAGEGRIVNRKIYEFRRFVEENGYYIQLGRGAFRKSGTDTGTLIIVLDKLYERERLMMESTPCEGYLNYYTYLVDVVSSNTRKRYEETLRIYERIRQGDLPIKLLGEAVDETYHVIRRFFVEAVREMRREGAHLPMKERFYEYLVQEVFMERYAEWFSDQAEGRDRDLERIAA